MDFYWCFGETWEGGVSIFPYGEILEFGEKLSVSLG
jgi:hypothetical protein